MWPGSHPSAAASSSRYGMPPEVGMFVVAPATSFHHPHSDPSMISPDPTHPINVGVIPLLTASMDDSVDLIGNRSRGGAIQFWQQNNQAHHHHQQQQQAAYFNKPGSINFDHNTAVNLMGSGGGDGGAVVGSGGGPTATCQDCGNQAKKDCSHRRCRTCCRSRGFDCTTHVRSTWVPAARRRERQMMGVPGSGGGGGGASSGSTSGAKKPRLIASQNTATTTSHTSNSNTPPRSYETSSSHQDAGLKESLPRQVRAPAVFKCVRVTAVEDGEDEYAYQAVVRIGGHVFKGFLYDQGAESSDGFPNLSELHLGGGGGRNGASSSSPILDQPEVYAASGGGFLGAGSTYGNTIN